MPDYNRYDYSVKEKLKYFCQAAAYIVLLALLCYNSLIFAVILSPFIPYFLHTRKNKLMEARRWKLNLQFCDGINCISAALESGYSIENAVAEAYHDMKLTYDENAEIMQELKIIIGGINNNMSVEEAFSGLAERSGLEDIQSFADIFATAKRTGGNIMAIIRSTSDVIHTRVELKRELRTVIASKKYEADIMKLIPFAMLLYLRVFSPDMVAALYGNLFGVVFMTVILVIYLILCRVSDYVIKIDL